MSDSSPPQTSRWGPGSIGLPLECCGGFFLSAWIFPPSHSVRANWIRGMGPSRRRQRGVHITGRFVDHHFSTAWGGGSS